MNATCVKSGLLLLITVGLSGCFTTTVRSGKPPAPAVAEYDGKWHSGVVYGLAELSGPYDLKEVCPNGWSEITTETSFVNGLVSSLTGNIYNPQSVTVRCSTGGAAEAAEPAKDAAEDGAAEEGAADEAAGDDAPAEEAEAAE
jgi:Bor protein